MSGSVRERHLESGGRQVGDGDVLQVVLQRVDERGHGQLQGVSVLHHHGVVEQQHRLLHAAYRGESERHRGRLQSLVASYDTPGWFFFLV